MKRAGGIDPPWVAQVYAKAVSRQRMIQPWDGVAGAGAREGRAPGSAGDRPVTPVGAGGAYGDCRSRGWLSTGSGSVPGISSLNKPTRASPEMASCSIRYSATCTKLGLVVDQHFLGLPR